MCIHVQVRVCGFRYVCVSGIVRVRTSQNFVYRYANPLYSFTSIRVVFVLGPLFSPTKSRRDGSRVRVMLLVGSPRDVSRRLLPPRGGRYAGRQTFRRTTRVVWEDTVVRERDFRTERWS